MRILSARIFLSLLAGKLKIFKQMLTSFFKKNWRRRILSARIFSKSFGGKIKNFQTDVDMCFFKKLAHAYFECPYFFQVFWRENRNCLNRK